MKKLRMNQVIRTMMAKRNSGALREERRTASKAKMAVVPCVTRNRPIGLAPVVINRMPESIRSAARAKRIRRAMKYPTESVIMAMVFLW